MLGVRAEGVPEEGEVVGEAMAAGAGSSGEFSASARKGRALVRNSSSVEWTDMRWSKGVLMGGSFGWGGWSVTAGP